jgi:hypothetical protein
MPLIIELVVPLSKIQRQLVAFDEATVVPPEILGDPPTTEPLALSFFLHEKKLNNMSRANVHRINSFMNRK